jgi:hypothetical protein
MTLAKIKASLKAKRAALEAVKLVERTIRLCAWGQVYHAAIDFAVDREFIAQHAAYLDWRRARNESPPPILCQHQEQGESFGMVKGLEAREDGPYLVLGMLPELAAKYDAGRLPYWSPHFEWEFPDPHRPAEDDPAKPHIWPVRLREVSFVSVPHLLNNPPAGVELGGSTTTRSARVLCAAQPQKEDKKMELTPEQIAAIAQAVAPAVAEAVITRLKSEVEIEMAGGDPAKSEDKAGAQMADPKAGEEPAAAQMANKKGGAKAEEKAGADGAAMLSSTVETLTTKVNAQEARNAKLESELLAERRLRVEGEVRAEMAGASIDKKDFDNLVKVKMSGDLGLYGTMARGLRAAAMASGTFERGGVGESASTKGSATLKADVLAAKKQGVKLGAPLLKHLREQGYDTMALSPSEHEMLRKAYQS